MARTTAPLFSLDASGSVGKSITFSKWRGRNYVRRLVTPANPKSGLQTGVRSFFRYLSQAWAPLVTGAKASWAPVSDPTNVPLFNGYMGDNLAQVRQELGIRMDFTDTPSGTQGTPITPAVTAGPTSLTFTWAPDATNPSDWSYAISMFTSSGFTPAVANVVRVVPIATLSVTVTDLVPGTTYYFVVRGFYANSLIGLPSAEASGTPTG